MKIKFQEATGCSKFDKLTLEEEKEFFDSINPEDIINGKKEYLYDRGMLYYKRFSKWKKNKDFQEAEANFISCYSEFQQLMCQWNLMLLYYFNDNCGKASECLNEYLVNADKILDIQLSEINLIKKECSNK